MGLTEIDAFRAYARMTNTLDVSHIESLLDENVRYASHWMVGEIASKHEFLDYMKSGLLELKQAGIRGYAEIALASAWGHNECAATAQGERKFNSHCVHCVDERKDQANRQCGTTPDETMRTGEYPS